MDLREYVSLLWRWLWLIILGTVIAGAAAFLVSQNQAPVYRSSSILLVNEGTADSNEYRSLLVGEQLAQSYVKRLTNYEVLSQSLRNLGLTMDPADLQKTLQVALVDETQLISLSVSHADPHIASDLANEIPKVFAARNVAQQQERFASSKASLETELANLQAELQLAEAALDEARQKRPTNSAAIDLANNNVLRLRETHSRLLESYETVRLAEASSMNTISIDEQARPSTSPISPRILNNTLLAAVVGGMLALGIAFLIEYMDDTIKNPHDIEQGVGLTPLGSVGYMSINQSSDALVVAIDPRSPTSEAFRHIRTNIQYLSVDKPLQTMLITSANMGEGKSTVASNLATALAQSGKRVILVDADMRRPNLHKLLEVDGSKGLANLIIRGREDINFLKGTLITNLRLLPAGRIPPNPAELLGSERMREVIAWLKEQADYVIFDSPPLLAVTDGAVLSKLVDTTLVVVAPTTRFPAFVAAARQIQALEGHISGVIMNKVTSRQAHYYHYYSSAYYYRADDEEPENGGNGHGHSKGNGRRSWKQWVYQALYSLNILH